MIVGLGIDIVEISRVKKAMLRPRFISRILTPREREFCVTPTQVAGRWAAKEAVYKALGVPLRWQQIEILPDPLGGPTVTINSSQYDPGRLKLKVSITHERNYAAAIALVERLVYQAPHP
ncbi:MAG TPA: holo-ACP synthase [Fimbriimonas sp.]|nr:holo-ACP synthase [Fimbriimonas sp.]